MLPCNWCWIPNLDLNQFRIATVLVDWLDVAASSSPRDFINSPVPLESHCSSVEFRLFNWNLKETFASQLKLCKKRFGIRLEQSMTQTILTAIWLRCCGIEIRGISRDIGNTNRICLKGLWIMNQISTPKFGIGAPVRRKEDAAFVTGAGSYVDDYAPANLLYGLMVRSPIAHARFAITNVDDVSAAPGVKLVVTAKDVSHFGDLPTEVVMKQADGSDHPIPERKVLCTDTVRYVGDGIAFIVADSLNDAKSAAEMLDIDFEPLDAVVGIQSALKDGAPLVWPEIGSNTAFHYAIGNKEETDKAFSDAAKTVGIEIVNNRLIANYMEPRACVAEHDSGSGRYTLTVGTQGGHAVRDIICKNVLKIDTKLMRVVTPDVGGGFGTKVWAYREYPLCCFAAEKLGRPVKWLADRTDHFLSDTHGRDNLTSAEFALDAGGRIQGLRVKLYADMGANLNQYGPFIPWLGATMSTGPYDIQNLYVDIFGIYTNSVATDAYRGAGRPEAAYVLERLADKAAHELGMSPPEFRRINLIQSDSLPYTTKTDHYYDSGDFVGQMDKALENADWAGFESRIAESRARGRYRGIGMGTYIEACAFSGSEEANVVLNEDGKITLYIGTQSNGQGHATAYGQVLAEIFGIDMDRIEMVQGDTDQVQKGGGTGGSRSIPIALPSIDGAGRKLVEQLKELASNKLEASTEDLELSGGEVRVAGTDRGITLAEIARTTDDKDKLKANDEVNQAKNTYPNGTHICELEIDPETGQIELLNFTIVDDFGVTLNPLLLAGQVRGGVVQSIGQALLEKTVYDDSGQLLTASLMDYAMPRAADISPIEFETRNIPSTNNAMGLKGAGEAGTIGATPAVVNAISDALRRETGVADIDMPATPDRVWQVIQNAKQ